MMQQIEHLEELYKIGMTSPQAKAWSPGKVFARDERDAVKHLRIAAESEQVQLIETLVEKMQEPFWLLYVLVVPRGEGQPGRYQAPEPLTRKQVKAFLTRFRNFLEADGRQNLWIKSESGRGLLVWDRHNLVYAYDLENEWSEKLQGMGWIEVNRDAIALPDPHEHHYHAIFDDDARDVLAAMQWDYSPLREQDY
jgi:hypothetical protein